MTNREFYTAIAANETLPEDVRTHATEALAKLDATAEKRKGVVSKKDLEKRAANADLAVKVATEILATEPKTASDVAAALTEITGEEFNSSKASYLCRKAVEMGLATQTEVKVPKRGTLKAYTAVTAPVGEAE